MALASTFLKQRAESVLNVKINKTAIEQQQQQQQQIVQYKI